MSGDDDSGAGTDARLQFQAAYTGVYYARVTEWADRYGTAFWYHLQVTETAAVQLYLPLILRTYP